MITLVLEMIHRNIITYNLIQNLNQLKIVVHSQTAVLHVSEDHPL